MKEKSSFGALIDAPIEEVKKQLEEGNYDLTHLINIKKGLEMEYQRVESTKNAMIHGVANNTIEEGKAKDLISSLFVILQRIEDLCTVIEELKNQRKVKH